MLVTISSPYKSPPIPQGKNRQAQHALNQVATLKRKLRESEALVKKLWGEPQHLEILPPHVDWYTKGSKSRRKVGPAGDADGEGTPGEDGPPPSYLGSMLQLDLRVHVKVRKEKEARERKRIQENKSDRERVRLEKETAQANKARAASVARRPCSRTGRPALLSAAAASTAPKIDGNTVFPQLV